MTDHIDTDGVFEEEPEPLPPISPEAERHIRQYIETAKKVMLEQGPMAFGWAAPIKPDLQYLVAKLTNDLLTIEELTKILNEGWRIGEPPITHQDFTILILCKEKESKPGADNNA